MLGRTLGHYRIESKLGEGGMGVVYRAFDTHLDRPVAIKILRPEAIGSPERRRRFVQEAKAASALNHPNIIHVYDIDNADGTDFIAMEFVPGKTLDQCIGRSGLSLKDTLKYSIQIADGLARAHAAGIVHRDLKPANIIVADDGRVKLLDFGLAKLTESIASEPDAATLTMNAHEKPQTEEGLIVGTVAYMSPEQAEGKKVDARSDIFSFGSVLYEMVTGRRAFGGPTKVSTLSAVLHKEPQPLGEIVPNLPAEMEKIILRCLRKDPDRRTRHMDDVKLAIEDLKEESESGGVASLIGVTSSRRRPYAKSSSIRVAVIAAGVVVSIAGAVVAWRAARRFPGAQFTSNTVLTRLTNDSGLTTDPALSPDGKLVAYASDREGHGNLDIWVQQVSGGQAIQLTHDAADDREPSFSPDGTRIALRSERDGGGIYVVSTFGGEEKLVARQGRRPRFSPDGSKIAYWVGNVGGDPSVSGTSKIYTVASTGGSPQQLGPGLPVARYPIWSADGKQILFWGIGNARGRESTEDWWVIPVAGGQAVETGAFAEFRRAGLQEPLGAYMIIPADWAVLQDRVMFAAQFGDSTNVWQIPIGVDGRAVGAPQRLTSGSGLEMHPAGGARGSFVFSSLQNRIDLWTLPVDANRARVGGDAQRLTDDASLHLAPVVAANGTRVAFISKRSGTWEVWVKDLASGKLSSVAVLPSIIGWPAISAEGSTVAYVAHQGVNNPKNEIFTTPATGGQSERVCAGCNAAYSFSSDGKRMLIWQMNSRGISLLDLISKTTSEILNRPGYAIFRARFSPDDGWIAFHARNRPDRSALFVTPFREAEPIPERDWIPITADSYDINAAWSPDGNVIYFLSERDGFRCIWAQRLDAVTKHPTGTPIPIQHFHTASRSMIPFTTNWLGLSTTRAMLVFNVGDLAGNIWMARPAF